MRVIQLAVILLCTSVHAAQVTCTGTVTESAVNLACSGSAPSNPAPSCSVSVSPPSIQGPTTGTTTVSLTANCSGSPTSYAWGNSPNAPPVSGSGATVSATFGPGTPPASYTYSVTASNAAGSGTASGAFTVTASGGSTVGCNPTGIFTGAGQWKDFTLSPGGVAVFQLPPLTQAGRWAEMIAVQTDQTPGDLVSEIAISETCGNFDVAPLCKKTGSAWSLNLMAWASPNTGFCTLTPGRTYYANVRNPIVSGPGSCAGNCPQRISYNGNMQ